MQWHVGVSTEFEATELVAAGVLAEQLGFDGFWLTDIRQLRDCYTVLGAIAGRTETIALASGVSDPFTRHPLHLCESIGTLEELAPGRAILGLGAGAPHAVALIGGAHREPAATLEKAAWAIRQMVSGGRCSMAHPAFSVCNSALAFGSKAITLAVVAHGPRIYAAAGRVADIALIAHYKDLAAIAWAQEQIARGSRERGEGLEPVRCVLRIDICLARDRAIARQVMLKRVGDSLRSGYYSKAFLAPLGFGHLAASGREPSDAEVGQVARAVAIAGDEADAAQELTTLAQTPGISGINCRVFPAPGENLRLGLSRLAAARSP